MVFTVTLTDKNELTSEESTIYKQLIADEMRVESEQVVLTIITGSVTPGSVIIESSVNLGSQDDTTKADEVVTKVSQEIVDRIGDADLGASVCRNPSSPHNQ